VKWRDVCGRGNYSPVKKIREKRLWLVQHLGINERDKEIILRAVEETKKRMKIAE